MKNYIILSATALSIMAGMVSCTELLDTAPSNKISQSTMWTTEALVDQGVIGVYYSLQRPINGNQIVGASNDIGYYGFEAYGMTGQGEYGIDGLFASNVTAGNTRFSYHWKWCYSGINRANAAIEQIALAPINNEKKARLVAECKTLRAFFYMRLNEMFGRDGFGVPLYLESVDPDKYDRGQSPESDVWAAIIQDLTDAINEPNLKNNDIQGEGRVSKGTAYALRGRAYLLTKSYSEAATDFEKVGQMGYGLSSDYRKLFKVENERCEEMIMSVQYIEDPTGYGTGIQKFTAAFQQGAKDSRGCWTDLQVTPMLVDLYEEVVDANTVRPFDWKHFFPNWDEISASGTKNRKVYFLRDKLLDGNEITAATTTAINTELTKLDANIQELYLAEGNEARLKEAYANRDPRLAMNVVTPYADFRGVNSNSSEEAWYTYRWPVAGKYYADQAAAEPKTNTALPATYYTSGSCNAQAEFKYIHRKFVGEGLEYMRREQNPVDEPIIRYADVLLMWAEAEVEQGGSEHLAKAKSLVKQIRDRVGVPTMDASFADQTIARNYVRDERRRELMGEGVNFFDEMRWKTLKETKYAQVNAQNAWGGTESTGGTTYQWPGDYFYCWPVPAAEVEKNKNLTKTPGWMY
ncbi:RagB/SusD family nutrient uptake outer membrane protein [Bacteroides sp. UBA939]|uniref:RagB/SusD family nutrient uptake outer membrane protein n=1 Tax=Bacteroides sp. UBA939 TaxID=1946092 RepID=UPI0025BE7498|nr:RagB/SusD family nutrient uptake outer membrane protein [Bacteroides sp. UBA939]